MFGKQNRCLKPQAEALLIPILAWNELAPIGMAVA
jgi:hypothetical protein